MLDTGISSTVRIARGWGLVNNADVAAAEGPVLATASPALSIDIEAIVEGASHFAKSNLKKNRAGKPDDTQGVGKIITDALRAAGLMR